MTVPKSNPADDALLKRIDKLISGKIDTSPSREKSLKGSIEYHEKRAREFEANHNTISAKHSRERANTARQRLQKLYAERAKRGK